VHRPYRPCPSGALDRPDHITATPPDTGIARPADLEDPSTVDDHVFRDRRHLRILQADYALVIDGYVRPQIAFR